MKVTHKSICILLLSVAILICSKARSQNTPAKYFIYGKIIDSAARRPLEHTAVTFYEHNFSLIKTLLTKEDGSFAFQGSISNKCLVIEAFGYHHKTIIITAIELKDSLNLDTILMSNKAGSLGEVVVTATKPLIKQEIDKIVYDLQADPESKESSLLQMMRKVPFLSQDANENILLKGSRDYKILINGKASGMMERAPMDILKSIPASTIKSIEVITNPSAKYDAEGLAGIINIITNKKIDNGYNGSVNISHKFPIGGPAVGLSYTMKQGKFGISSFGGTGFNQSPQTTDFYKRETAAGDHKLYLDQNIARESGNKYGYFGSELSFEIDSLHLISAQLNFNSSKTDATVGQVSIIQSSGAVWQQYNLANKEEGRAGGIDASANYQLGFKSGKERLLTFSYRYSSQQNRQFNNIDVFQSFNYADADYLQLNNGNFKEQTAQVDYIQPIKKHSMEAGIKSILRTNYSNFEANIFDTGSGRFEQDADRTNEYTNRQHIFSAYNSYQLKLKAWGFKGGFRLEQTYVNADFVTGAANVQQDYLSIIPSFIVNRNLKNQSTLNLSFTSRIKRPTIFQLNPFVDRSNPEFESTGNANLKPATTNVIQLSYSKSKKTSINIAIGSMFFKGLIGPLSAYDSARKLNTITFENLGKGRILKTNLFLNHPITKNWNVGLNSDIRHISFSGMANGILFKNEGFNISTNISSGFRFDNGFRLNTGLSLISGGISGVQGTSNGYIGSYFNTSKDIIKNMLSVSAGITNPFSQFRKNREELYGNGFTQVIDRQTYFRGFSFSANYRFGKLKENIKKNKRSINNDDRSD